MTHEEELNKAAEEHINEALFKWSYDDEDGIEQYVYDAFIAGAKWAMGQGETYKVKVIKDGVDGFKTIQHTVESFEPEEEVIIQIRKRR